MVVKSISDFVGPDGIEPTLLVFGAILRLQLPTDPPIQSTLQHANAVWKVTKTTSRHFAKMQVQDATRPRNGLHSTDIQKAAVSSPVLLYCLEKNVWEGPFSLLGIRAKDLFVLLPTTTGPKKSRSTVVCPYNARKPPSQSPSSETDSKLLAHDTISGTVDADVDIKNQFVEENFVLIELDIPTNPEDMLPATYKAHTPQICDNGFYKASRAKEFNGLIDEGMFQLVEANGAAGHRVYNFFRGRDKKQRHSRCIRQIKTCYTSLPG